MRPCTALACSLAAITLSIQVPRIVHSTSATARSVVRQAVTKTLDAPALRDVRTSSSGKAESPVVEEYTAPGRVRQVRPAWSSPLGPVSVTYPQTILIGIGHWQYVLDSRALPPRDQLFVACKLKHGFVPEVFGALALIEKTTNLRRVSVDHYRFQLDGGKPDLGVRHAAGDIVISHGRIARLAFSNRSGASVVWTLAYAGISPITAPTPEQIARSDCELTQPEPSIPATAGG